MLRFHHLPFLLLLVASCSLAKEPHRCVRDGKVTITDVPCSAINATETNPRYLQAPTASPVAPPLKPAPVSIHAPITAPINIALGAERPGVLAGLFDHGGFLIIAAILAAALIGNLIRSSHRQSPTLRLHEPDFGSVLPPVTEGKTREVLPYRQSAVMSPTELGFFADLREALPECEIFPQVPLAAFIRIDRSKAGIRYFGNSYRWQNRIGQQRVDYLVCRRSDLGIIAAVELDDSSHDRAEAQARDRKKDESLAHAGVRLVRWHVKARPDSAAIRREMLGDTGTAALPPAP